MKEELITLDTAKLAKEKGFKELTNNYFSEDEKVSEVDLDFQDWNTGLNTFKNIPTISRPTQSLLAKWLRENYNIFVTPSYTSCGYGTGWHWVIYKDIKKDYQDFVCSMIDKKLPLYDNFEEALELGLQEALKLIK